MRQQNPRDYVSSHDLMLRALKGLIFDVKGGKL